MNNSERVASDVEFEQQNDFMVSLVPSSKFGCLYGISQQGHLFVFDIETGTQIYRRRVSNVCWSIYIDN